MQQHSAGGTPVLLTPRAEIEYDSFMDTEAGLGAKQITCSIRKIHLQTAGAPSTLPADFYAFYMGVEAFGLGDADNIGGVFGELLFVKFDDAC